MKRVSIAVCIMGLLVSNEFCMQAQSTGDYLKEFNCYDGSQLDMNLCSLKEYQYYDSLLNVDYKRIMSNLNEQLKEEKEYDDNFEYNRTVKLKNSIIVSQRSWIMLRDKNAEVVANQYEGGTIQPLVVNQQMILDTQNRLRFLKLMSKFWEY